MSIARRLALVSGALVGLTSLGQAQQPTITINSAVYYDQTGYSRSCDFNLTCANDQCNDITIQNGICPKINDPANGGNKEAAIVYTCSWSGVPADQKLLFRSVRKINVTAEHVTAHISCVGQPPLPASAETIKISSAVYGQPGAGHKTCSFGNLAESQCNEATSCTIPAHGGAPSLNWLCGDPDVGNRDKHAVIEFTCLQPNGDTASGPTKVDAREAGALTVACPVGQ